MTRHSREDHQEEDADPAEEELEHSPEEEEVSEVDAAVDMVQGPTAFNQSIKFIFLDSREASLKPTWPTFLAPSE